MIRGIGTDVVEINRFRNLNQKTEFLEQVLTREEINGAPTDPTSDDAHFATLFALKEAMLKALGCGLETGSHWHDIHVTCDWNIYLTGILGRRADEDSISTILTSHSYSETTAIAFVIISTTNEKVTP